jgi:hypothetical protein
MNGVDTQNLTGPKSKDLMEQLAKAKAQLEVGTLT